MSISATLKDATKKGNLCFLDLQSSGDPIRRTMLLHPDVRSALDCWVDMPRMAELRNDLESFVTGKHFTMSFKPRKHKKARMGLLEPAAEGTWDIRSFHKSPGIRVFGRFAAPDIFVALEWRPRSVPMPGFDKAHLAARSAGDEWQFAMIEVEQRWAACLPDLKPVIGGQISDYITENCSAV